MLGFEIQKNIDNQPFRKPIRFQKILAPSRLLGIELSMSQQGVGSCLASARARPACAWSLDRKPDQKARQIVVRLIAR
jgi:hypothetical protein